MLERICIIFIECIFTQIHRNSIVSVLKSKADGKRKSEFDFSFINLPYY